MHNSTQLLYTPMYMYMHTTAVYQIIHTSLSIYIHHSDIITVYTMYACIHVYMYVCIKQMYTSRIRDGRRARGARS